MPYFKKSNKKKKKMKRNALQWRPISVGYRQKLTLLKWKSNINAKKLQLTYWNKHTKKKKKWKINNDWEKREEKNKSWEKWIKTRKKGKEKLKIKEKKKKIKT